MLLFYLGIYLDNALSLRVRQTLGIIFGVTEMLFFGGIIFGFNALIPILKTESIYSHLCLKNQSLCPEQNVMFGFAFTTYMAVQMVMLTVVGLLIDNVGLRIVKLGSAILFSLGAGLFAVITTETPWLIFPAGCFLCVGGMANLICTFSVSKLFGKTSTIMLAFIIGAFDASSCIFALAGIAYDAGFSYQFIFYLLGGANLILNIFSSNFITTYWMADMEKIQQHTVISRVDDDEKHLKVEAEYYFLTTYVSKIKIFILIDNSDEIHMKC